MNVDGWIVLAQIVNFLLLVWLLKRFLYEPVRKVIAEREARLLEERKSAAAREAAARAEEEKYRQLAAGLEAERRRILDEAVAEAERERQRLLEEATQRVAAAREEMFERLRSERAELAAEIRRGIVREASLAAGRILREVSGESIDEAVIDRAARELARVPPPGLGEEALEVALEIATSFDPTPEQKSRLRAVVEAWMGRKGLPLTFRHDPDLILGIEVAAAGERVGWTARDVLEAVEARALARLGPEEEAGDGAAGGVRGA